MIPSLLSGYAASVLQSLQTSWPAVKALPGWVLVVSSRGNNDDIIRISNWFLHRDFSSARIFAVQTSSARFVCCCFPAMCSLMTPLQNTLDINYLCHFMCTEEVSQCSEVHPVSLLNSPATCVLWPYYGFPDP